MLSTLALTGKISDFSLPADRSVPHTTGPTTLVVDSRRLLFTVFFACVAIEILLFLLDLTINHQRGSSSGAIRRLFNTAREDSLASWFAITQTFVVALVAWSIVLLMRAANASIRNRIGWIIVAAFFTYMAVDDGAKVHERLGTASKELIAASDTLAAYPSYGWQLVVGPFFVLAGLFLLVFLWRELRAPVARFGLLTALSCFAIAVGMDFIEGVEGGHDWVTEYTDSSLAAIRHFGKSIEECIEMLGVSIFLILFLSHLMRNFRSVKVKFE